MVSSLSGALRTPVRSPGGLVAPDFPPSCRGHPGRTAPDFSEVVQSVTACSSRDTFMIHGTLSREPAGQQANEAGVAELQSRPNRGIRRRILVPSRNVGRPWSGGPWRKFLEPLCRTFRRPRIWTTDHGPIHMTSAEIRQSFLDFFVRNAHARAQFQPDAGQPEPAVHQCRG